MSLTLGVSDLISVQGSHLQLRLAGRRLASRRHDPCKADGGADTTRPRSLGGIGNSRRCDATLALLRALLHPSIDRQRRAQQQRARRVGIGARGQGAAVVVAVAAAPASGDGPRAELDDSHPVTCRKQQVLCTDRSLQHLRLHFWPLHELLSLSPTPPDTTSGLYIFARRIEGFAKTSRCSGVISSTHAGYVTSPTPAESAHPIDNKHGHLISSLRKRTSSTSLVQHVCTRLEEGKDAHAELPGLNL
eukprot:COSAG04_NODE_3379_length_2871_cov_1.321918_3_plen_247_part_00